MEKFRDEIEGLHSQIETMSIEELRDLCRTLHGLYCQAKQELHDRPEPVLPFYAPSDNPIRLEPIKPFASFTSRTMSGGEGLGAK